MSLSAIKSEDSNMSVVKTTEAKPNKGSMVSVYKSVTSTRAISTESSMEMRHKIKNGYYKTEVGKYRSGELAKNKITCFTPSGTFTAGRTDDDLSEYSDEICMDLDDVLSDDVGHRTKGDPFILSRHVSLSGTGTALYFKTEKNQQKGIDAIKKQHKKTYEAISSYLLTKYGLKSDPSCKNLSRLRYVSDDSDAYINEEATVFTVPDSNLLTDRGHDVSNVRPEVEEDTDLVEDFARLKSDPDETFINTCEEIEQRRIDITKGYDNWLKILFGIANKQGEAGRSFAHTVSQFHPDYNYDECDRKYSNCLKSDDQKNSQYRGITIATFYKIASKHLGPKNSLVQRSGTWMNNGKSTIVELCTGTTVSRLIAAGYSRHGSGFVRFSDGIVRKVDAKELYKIIVDMCCAAPVSFKAKKNGLEFEFTVDVNQLRTICQRTLKGNVIQLALPAFIREVTRDTRDKMYFHFLNKSIVVTKEGIYEISREDLCIWDTQLIRHDLIEEDVLAISHFAEFLENIAGNNYKAFYSALGYLLHNYNGSNGSRAVWLYEENYEPGRVKGGTGKSLLTKAVGKLRKVVRYAGKDLHGGDKFKFQLTDYDTQIQVIDDPKETFDFSDRFNDVTEGLEFQKKYADKVQLTIAETPKLAIASNYPPPVEQGASVTRRLLVLPVKPYYSQFEDAGGVQHVHGHIFFDDWDESEWSNFFWFMINCAHNYLRDGLRMIDSDTTARNRLKVVCSDKLGDNEQGSDLVEWLFSQDPAAFKRFNLAELLSAWTDNSSGFSYESFSINDTAFAGCLKAFFDLKGWSVQKKLERVDGHVRRFWKVGTKG